MLTWQLDRLFRSGPLCAAATFALPAVLAFIVAGVSDVENVLGIVLIASILMFLGTVFGSVVTTGLGALLFGTGAYVAEVPAALLLIVGIVLFATVMLHDLAGTFRRAPSIKRSVWITAASITALISGAGAVAFSLTYFVATLSIWQSIVVPFALAAIGFAVKLAADSHVVAGRQLTAKRSLDQQQDG